MKRYSHSDSITTADNCPLITVYRDDLKHSDHELGPHTTEAKISKELLRNRSLREKRHLFLERVFHTMFGLEIDADHDVNGQATLMQTKKSEKVPVWFDDHMIDYSRILDADHTLITPDMISGLPELQNWVGYEMYFFKKDCGNMLLGTSVSVYLGYCTEANAMFVESKVHEFATWVKSNWTKHRKFKFFESLQPDPAKRIVVDVAVIQLCGKTFSFDPVKVMKEDFIFKSCNYLRATVFKDCFTFISWERVPQSKESDSVVVDIVPRYSSSSDGLLIGHVATRDSCFIGDNETLSELVVSGIRLGDYSFQTLSMLDDEMYEAMKIPQRYYTSKSNGIPIVEYFRA